MPYSNIVFVKLFLSLFEEDDRFLYQLNESQQLLYIKLLYLAGSSNNQISKNHRFISHKVNYHHEETCLISDIKRIMEVFPKFKDQGTHYSFEKFEELHNYIGKSKGNPKEIQRIVPDKEKSKRRVREDKEKKSAKLPFKEPSQEQKDLLTKYSKIIKGINIFQLMGKIGKNGYPPPPAVIITACESYFKHKDSIQDLWPWFSRVVEDETKKYYANLNSQPVEGFKPLGLEGCVKGVK